VLLVDVGLTVALAIEARDGTLTPGNRDVSNGDEGAVKDCPIEGMNLSKCTLRGRPLYS
jgi:hypothetical protein